MKWDQSVTDLSQFKQNNQINQWDQSVILNNSNTDLETSTNFSRLLNQEISNFDELLNAKQSNNDKSKKPKLNYYELSKDLTDTDNILSKQLDSLQKNPNNKSFNLFKLNLKNNYMPLLPQIDHSVKQNSVRLTRLERILNDKAIKSINHYRRTIKNTTLITNYNNACIKNNLPIENSTLQFENLDAISKARNKYLEVQKQMPKQNLENIPLNNLKGYLLILKTYWSHISCKRLISVDEAKEKNKIRDKMQRIEKIISTAEQRENKIKKQQEKNKQRIDKIKQYENLIESVDNVDFNTILIDILDLEKLLLTENDVDTNLETITLLSKIIDLLDKQYNQEMRFDYFSNLSNSIESLESALIYHQNGKEAIELMIAIHKKTLQNLTDAFVDIVENISNKDEFDQSIDTYLPQDNLILQPYRKKIKKALNSILDEEKEEVVTIEETSEQQYNDDEKLFIQYMLNSAINPSSQRWNAVAKLQEILDLIPENNQTFAEQRKKLTQKINTISNKENQDHTIDYSKDEQEQRRLEIETQLQNEQIEREIRLQQEESAKKTSQKTTFILEELNEETFEQMRRKEQEQLEQLKKDKQSKQITQRLLEQIAQETPIIPSENRDAINTILAEDYIEIFNAIQRIQSFDYLLSILADDVLRPFLGINDERYPILLQNLNNLEINFITNKDSKKFFDQWLTIVKNLQGLPEKNKDFIEPKIKECNEKAQVVTNKIIESFTATNGEYYNSSITDITKLINATFADARNNNEKSLLKHYYDQVIETLDKKEQNRLALLKLEQEKEKQQKSKQITKNLLEKIDQKAAIILSENRDAIDTILAEDYAKIFNAINGIQSFDYLSSILANDKSIEYLNINQKTPWDILIQSLLARLTSMSLNSVDSDNIFLCLNNINSIIKKLDPETKICKQLIQRKEDLKTILISYYIGVTQNGSTTSFQETKLTKTEKVQIPFMINSILKDLDESDRQSIIKAITEKQTTTNNNSSDSKIENENSHNNNQPNSTVENNKQNSNSQPYPPFHPVVRLLWWPFKQIGNLFSWLLSWVW